MGGRHLLVQRERVPEGRRESFRGESEGDKRERERERERHTHTQIRGK